MKWSPSRVVTRLAVVLVLLALAVMSNVPRPQKTMAAPTSNPNKITICHRTHATTNPYRRITVNVSSIFNGNPSSSLDDPQANGNGHGRFQHNDWIDSEAWFASNKSDNTKARPVPNVFNPNTTYPSNKKRWGDIIPDVKVNGNPANRTAAPLNYDPGNTSHAGYAIYHNLSYNGDSRYASLCKRMTAKDYCDSLITELVNNGSSQSAAETACMEELEEQDALEDAPLKTACLGDLSTCSISKLNVYGTSTGSASCSNGVATFNGSTNMSTLSGEPTFDVGTTTALGTSISASPTTVTGAASFTATYNIPGDGTYYFKALVTTTDGNESVVGGDIVTLTVSGSNCSVTGAQTPMPTVDPTATTTTAPSSQASQVGSLTGTVWIDTDEDDSKDSSEIWIPGIVVTITGPTPGSGSTSSNGSFNFTNLAPGTYTVTATLPSGSGLRRTWDSQGEVNWVVVVTVVAGQTARADFAANGTMNVNGKLSTPPTTDPVQIDWGGLDDELDTPDDQTFEPKVNKDGSFTLTSAPTGRYRVRAQSVRATFTVTAKGANYKSAALSIVASPAVLPATGVSSGSTSRTIPVALMLLPLGLAAAIISRRRRVV